MTKPKEGDIVSNFFGEDGMDWEDDESSQSQGPLPVAPAKGALPAALDAEGWGKRVSAAPTDPANLSSATTLVYSQLQTLPPIDSPLGDNDPTEEPPRRTPSNPVQRGLGELPSSGVSPEGRSLDLLPEVESVPPPAAAEDDDLPPPPPFTDEVELSALPVRVPDATPAPVIRSATPAPAPTAVLASVPPPPPPFAPAGPLRTAKPVTLEELAASRVPEFGASTLDLSEEVEFPTLEVDPTSEEARRRARGAEMPDDLSEEVEVFGDQVVGDVEPVPMVRTKDPAPVRSSAPMGAEPARKSGPTFTPPTFGTSGEASTGTPWAPRGEVDEWQALAGWLVSEAARNPHRRGEWLAEAGLVYAVRLGDGNRAEPLLRDALATGVDRAEGRRELARILAARGQFVPAVEHIEARAKLAKGAEASDLYQEAALLAGQQVGDATRAARLLHAAVEADPTDYAAWSLLRDTLSETEGAGDRAQVLDRIASLAESGPLYTEARWEQGCVLHQAGTAAEARAALEAGWAANPGHQPTFVALEALFSGFTDGTALGDLYLSESTRVTDGPWWLGRAVSAYREGGASERAVEAAQGLLSCGVPALVRDGAAVIGTAEALAEAARKEPVAEARAALWYLCALRSEGEAAQAAWKEVLAADGSAEPAAQNIERALIRGGRDAEVRPARLARAQAMGLGPLRASAFVRLGIAAERSGDHAGARQAYESAGIEAPGAFDGLLRVHKALGDDESLVGLLRTWASLAPAGGARADRKLVAALLAPGASTMAATFVAEALADLPGHLVASEAAVGLAVSQGRYDEAREALAARGTDADTLRAAALAELTGADVVGYLNRILGGRGDHAVAKAWKRDQSLDQGGGGDQSESYRQLSATAPDVRTRAWFLLAAALAGPNPMKDALAILDDHQGFWPALVVAEHFAVRDGDRAGARAVAAQGTRLPADARRAEFLVRLAEAELDLGQNDAAARALNDLKAETGGQRPLGYAAHLARAVPTWEVAVTFLLGCPGLQEGLEAARLLARRVRRPGAALDAYRKLLLTWPGDVGVALGAARVAQQLDDRDSMKLANSILAEKSASGPVRAAYSSWTADLHEEAEQLDLAWERIGQALEARPGASKAFEAALRIANQRRDVDGTVALFEKWRPEAHGAMALALERLQAWDKAAAAWRREVEKTGAVSARFALERTLVQGGQWREAYDAALGIRAQLADPQARVAIDAKRRWMLAEKLADTDEAWTLYTALHEESPGDREVTESLARIAATRGDTALAVRYLGELAETAASPSDAARYRRRIGEAYEKTAEIGAARQAYLDALDHVPDDIETLAGLRRLAEREGDWNAIVAVLQREAGLAKGDRKLEVLREIARVTEAHIAAEPRVSMDSWRNVLELRQGDEEALGRIMALSEAVGEWQIFVDAGMQLATRWTGAARAELLRRVGIASRKHGEIEDAVRYFEMAVGEQPPDLEAARHLEDLYRARSDWEGTVRVLRLQSDHAGSIAERVALLERAAKIHMDISHDKDGAAAVYAEILELDGGHEGALRFRSAWLFEKGEFDLALPVCRALEPMVERGQDIDDFDTRMELSQFYFTFAQMLTLDGEPGDALKRYERALELNPSHLASLEATGPLYTAVGDWKKAEQVYRQLLQLIGSQGDRNKVATIYTQLGLVEQKLGSHEKAHKRFNKALEIFPNHVAALRGLAGILEERLDWSSLLAAYNNIIYYATRPEDVIDAYMNKGRILDQHMQRPDKAAQHYERSLAFDANQPQAVLRLAELAMRRKDYMEAGQLAQRGLHLAGEPGPLRAELLLVVASARKFAADNKVAQQSLSECFKCNPALRDELGDDPLADLEKVRAGLHSRLPRYYEPVVDLLGI